jgi:hypothetical protein
MINVLENLIYALRIGCAKLVAHPSKLAKGGAASVKKGWASPPNSPENSCTLDTNSSSKFTDSSTRSSDCLAILLLG